jgi:hypothetical protein
VSSEGQQWFRRTTEPVWKWFGVFWFYLASLIWHRMVTHEVSFVAAAWLLSLFVTSFLAGDVILRLVVRGTVRFDNQSTRLLTGMLFVNLLLFLAVLISPFRLAVVWLVIFVGTLGVWIGTRKYRQQPTSPEKEGQSEIFFLLILPVAITAWCWDILHPIESRDGIVVIHAWEDIYFHICQITAFASSHGISSMSDVQMSGAPVHPYHFATYLIPASLVDIAGGSSLSAFASLLVPLSVLLTALAAYSLAAVVFGSWPAMAAGLALMLLPDAFQQGFGNPYFGYHWLQQIAPGQGYGLAAAGIAFMFIFEACRKSQYRLVFLGWICALVCLTYKAQLFVAISLPALLFPILFMPGRLKHFRLTALVVASVLYFSVILLAQQIGSVPTMRLDGSGLTPYASAILGLQTDGYIRRVLVPLVNRGLEAGWFLGTIAFAATLIVSTFGVFSLFYLSLARSISRTFSSPVRFFPWCILVVYLVMGTGLAIDERKIGTPEELLHRPFVWAYFVIVVWCAGAAYHRFFGDAAPSDLRVRKMLALGVVCMIAVPAHFGREIATLKSKGIDFTSVPTCQFAVATFIREHSQPRDIIQDSSNDRRLALSALSERQGFAVDTGGIRAPSGLSSRLEALRWLGTTSDFAEVSRFMTDNSIKWYVIDRSDRAPWANDIVTPPTVRCGEYKAYRF